MATEGLGVDDWVTSDEDYQRVTRSRIVLQQVTHAMPDHARVVRPTCPLAGCDVKGSMTSVRVSPPQV
jgi:hypothetical protein